MPLIILIVR